ncbi:hypothetical protein G7Z17_g8661 [Cylindrodendrum hubeiense]|uniref:Uncharacterized protein n=1 Tax=Cylindrodendrum hubeiense TaxID=595255 RepID=A0A9P5H0U7_9HYPO|nr:hypothetical protein G7Z17_g8661 [Cylindrodendrum hubeiense]
MFLLNLFSGAAVLAAVAHAGPCKHQTQTIATSTTSLPAPTTTDGGAVAPVETFGLSATSPDNPLYEGQTFAYPAPRVQNYPKLYLPSAVPSDWLTDLHINPETQYLTAGDGRIFCISHTYSSGTQDPAFFWPCPADSPPMPGTDYPICTKSAAGDLQCSLTTLQGTYGHFYVGSDKWLMVTRSDHVNGANADGSRAIVGLKIGNLPEADGQ